MLNKYKRKPSDIGLSTLYIVNFIYDIETQINVFISLKLKIKGKKYRNLWQA